MAFILAAIYVLLASFGVGNPKRKPKVLLEQVTVHEFAELCRAAGVGARVAREMYRMLLPDYGNHMRSTLSRSFAELDASSESVWGMFEELVVKSGGVIRGRVGIEALGTPMAMIQAAEQCVLHLFSTPSSLLSRSQAALYAQVLGDAAAGQLIGDFRGRQPARG